MDILSPAVPFAHDPQLRARLSTSDDQVCRFRRAALHLAERTVRSRERASPSLEVIQVIFPFASLAESLPIASPRLRAACMNPEAERYG